MGYVDNPRDPQSGGPVRSLLTPPSVLILVATISVLSFACGGGGSTDDSSSLDLDSIPTATVPAVLPDTLIVGQNDVPISGATYTIQAGDTLLAIADQFGTTVNAIAEANDITDATSLNIGQVLIIPGLTDDDSVLVTTEEPPTDTPEPPDEPEPTNEPEPTDEPEPTEEEEPTLVDAPACEGNVHIVEEGEFPAVIAPLYGITVEELMAANVGIDPTTLQIGDCLIIPEPSSDEET